jgi:hypothetical protein
MLACMAAKACLKRRKVKASLGMSKGYLQTTARHSTARHDHTQFMICFLLYFLTRACYLHSYTWALQFARQQRRQCLAEQDQL